MDSNHSIPGERERVRKVYWKEWPMTKYGKVWQEHTAIGVFWLSCWSSAARYDENYSVHRRSHHGDATQREEGVTPVGVRRSHQHTGIQPYGSRRGREQRLEGQRSHWNEGARSR